MKRITVYCDGGCRGNGYSNNVGGWGFVLSCGEHMLERYGGETETTNNIMELMACIEALKVIKNKNYPVKVLSDSQYLVKGMNEWIFGWLKNDWKNSAGKPIKNQEQWMELHSLRVLFKDIAFVKVKGHSGNRGNERADRLANIAMDEIMERLREGKGA